MTDVSHDVAASERALASAERARDEAQAANRRLQFLVRASEILGESRDCAARLEALARLCVPEIADWVVVDVLQEDKRIVRLAAAHRIPEREADLRAMREPSGLASLSLPLTTRGMTLGALTLGALTLGALTLGMGPEPEGSGRPFPPETVLLAEDLARRAAVAVDNARVVDDLERAGARERDSLAQSEERFRLLVEQVSDYAIFMLDPEGNIATWNAGAQRFKGYTAEEIIGRHFSTFYTPEDIARRHPWNELQIAERDGRYEEEGWRVRKDGSRFWASVVITALRGEQGGALRGFAKVTRDVTDRRQREQERATAEALGQQRRFLKDVLLSVTEGRLALCDSPGDLPAPLSPQPVGEPVPLSARTLKAVRKRVREAAELFALPKDTTNDLITAASECAMNAAEHAGGGTARVFGDAEAGKVQVWVEDAGHGIDLTSLPRATLEPGFSTGGVGIGHGFSLIIACCQRVYLLTGTTGTTVVLEQARIAPEPTWLKSVGRE